MTVQLLLHGLEVGIVTTNLEPMLDFYRDLLGLEFQRDMEFPGGRMKRFALGQSVLKFVTFDEPPAEPSAAAGVRDGATGYRYVTLVVANVREMHAKLEAAGQPIDVPVTEFGPGVGYFFAIDPDGNRVELAGPV